jgi:RNA polymerase sigma-70 factor (ECF subfamily)
MSDEPGPEVLRRFVQGDRDAFERLFRQFEADVFRWAVKIVRDTRSAEDVVVEAFWRAYRGRARFDWSRSFGAWMRRITTNVACDYLRAERRTRAQHLGHDVPAAAASQPDSGEPIARVFRTLPPKLQIVATLVFIEERSHAEVADALAIPVGTVKSRLFRATRALRKELVRLGIEP